MPYLLLGGVEGEVAHIQSVALLQKLLLIIAITLKAQAMLQMFKKIALNKLTL